MYHCLFHNDLVLVYDHSLDEINNMNNKLNLLYKELEDEELEEEINKVKETYIVNAN